MHNLVLYRNVPELREKLNLLRQDPQRAAAIAEAGRQLAEQRYGFGAIGRQVVETMRPALRPARQASWLQRQLRKIGVYY